MLRGVSVARTVTTMRFDGAMIRVATVNVNGIRAAFRRGMSQWLAARNVDVLCLQEVRAPDAVVQEYLADSWHVAHAESEAKGRAGVAIASRLPLERVRVGVGEQYFAEAGRWIEADIATSEGPLTIVSVYVHSGEVDTPKQVDKYAFLDAMEVRMRELNAERERVVLVGDLNVGHRELDIKNWRGNRKHAGFLPEERVYFDRFFGEMGWVDVARSFAGEVPGPYTWWSWRGKAFDNDAGWRIDYQVVTPAIAERVLSATVDRADSYDERFSDHAPLVVDYDLDEAGFIQS